MRRPRMFGRAVAIVLIAGATLTACGGDAGSSGSTEFSAPPKTGLAAKLDEPPKYSQPGQTTWSREYTPTTDAFLKQFYVPKVRDKVAATLKQQQLQDIAHVFWVVDKAVASDIVLLQFADDAGAQARLKFATAPVKKNFDLKTYQAAAPGRPTVYYTPAADKQGYLMAKTYVAVGNVVLEMFVTATTDDLPRDEIAKWLTEQLARLS